MSLTKEQQAELVELAKPISLWLQKNMHPHAEVVVHTTDVEVLEGVLFVPNIVKFD